MSDASALPFQTPEPYSCAITASTPEASVLRPLTERHIAALAGRALDPELLARHGVGASSRLGGDAIGIPYTRAGVQVACKHRSLTGEKKFTQDAGGQQILWNVDCLADRSLDSEPLLIVEGELDAFSALQAGFPRVVSVPGGAPATRVAIDKENPSAGKKYGFLDEPDLAHASVIILATDSDEPGLNLRADLALRLGAHRCKWVQYPKGCKDLNDALRLFGERGVQATIRRAQPMQIHGYYEMAELPDVPEPRAHDAGIIGLGEHYKLRLGDLCVVTGVPGHGKSSFINEICCRMTQSHGWKTIFASFEQAPQTDHRRALRTFYAEKLEKMMGPQEIAAADAWIAKHFGFIVPGDDDDVTLVWLLEVMAQAVLRKEAQIVVIDPWNELDHTRPSDMTQTEYVGTAIKTLKKFARKYNVHLIIAAHPAKMLRTKDGKYPVPGLYDISDSAHWANKPDVGIVVHRENLTDGNSIIRVVKSRYHAIGVPGEVQGRWDVHRTRYLITDGVA